MGASVESHPAAASSVSRIGSSSNSKLGGVTADETSARGSEMTCYGSGGRIVRHSKAMGLVSPIQRLCSSSSSSTSSRSRQKMFFAVLCLLFLFSSDLGWLCVTAGSASSIFSFNASESVPWVAAASAAEERRTSRSPSGHFTPMWAVEIPGGVEVADDVARHHGFINHGRVSRSSC